VARRRRLRSTLVLGALLVASVGHADDLSTRADRYLQTLERERGFSGVVLIARDGKPLFERGYGMADPEHEVKNTPYTKFRLGSLSETFTAALVLMLEREGRLAVADSICNYVSPCPKAWRPVTLSELLTHTSGIGDYTEEPDFVATETLPSSPAAMAQKVGRRPLEFAPGTKLAYSPTGYVLLGMAAEKASGRSYEALLKARIFDPLAMNDSGYDHPELVLHHRARGTHRTLDGQRRNAAYLDMTIPFAAGALYSTAEDLLKWDEALYRDDVLPASVRARLFTPALKQYAFGWAVDTVGTHKRIWRSGRINGFTSHLSRFTADHVTVLVLANVEHLPIEEVALTLGGLVLDLPVPKPRVAITVLPEALDRFVGEYALRPDFHLVVRRQGDKLTVQPTGQPELALFADSERTFFSKAADAQITFEGEPGRPAASLTLHQGGRDRLAKRIGKEKQ
jgi:CubicO group peptidase (beta-lactamase class C family)